MTVDVIVCLSIMFGFVIGLLFPQLKFSARWFTIAHDKLPEVVETIKKLKNGS